MVTSYSDAIKILEREAASKSERFAEDGETLPITSAVGRICRDTHYSPHSTPLFDSSAMDGFAVKSEATSTASPDNPIIFRILDTIAAGDQVSSFPAVSRDGFISCVEMMTGHSFRSARMLSGRLSSMLASKSRTPVQSPVIIRNPDSSRSQSPYTPVNTRG